MGWGDVSYNTEYLQPGAGGSEWAVNPPRTPNIDRLAGMEGTMKFRRFYAGSAVCSPTRASVLSGRTPRRECIDSAEGCGQDPAWSCYDKLPFPQDTFTVAQAAAEAGYSTFFAGKWHLGDFWVKGEPPTYPMTKWPSSNPGHHGFQEWHATEASAESSTPNCGCVPEWKYQGKGCITGNGEWVNDALECTNYWRAAEETPECFAPATTTRDCVANLTQKIEGDDSEYIVDIFSNFLSKRNTSKPFFAFLWLHTNHVPHYALPEWYHAYNDTLGNPAGNYLGTISQMDYQIGRLHSLLSSSSLEDHTMMWFTVDNGAHIGSGVDEGRPGGQLSSSNGLRQCKASLFEGGIREPGFIRWPSVISGFKETNYTACTVDFLPTMLDILQRPYPNQSWPVDGTSLLPLLDGSMSLESKRAKPLGFGQSGQWALIHTINATVYKIIVNPAKGQCPDMLPPYVEGEAGPFLFNLEADPTESKDICGAQAEVCNVMKGLLEDFEASVANSRVNESGCAPPGKEDFFGKGRFGIRELDTPHFGKYRYETGNGCLSAFTVGGVDLLSITTCAAQAAFWPSAERIDEVMLYKDCTPDVPLQVGTQGTSAGLYFDEATGYIRSEACPSMCVVETQSSKVAQVTTATVSLGYCTTYGVQFRVQGK
eukprot:TRINITY_DN60_c0_g1_i1.p1 TRINITY_DN60_c0_g1~~TRINITY_DN60_c0_g1_i1.p1  ORF type:complete len:694 (+),score=216.79 TRINITY_DN60_c0_g1_i1:125-2083(+)